MPSLQSDTPARVRLVRYPQLEQAGDCLHCSRKPFPKHVRITRDLAGGAFYGWRFCAFARQRQRLTIALPAPSPTGPVWAERDRQYGRMRWYVPQQWHYGPLIRLEVEAGTKTIACAPTSQEPKQARFEKSNRRAEASGPSSFRVSIVAGQHPGEDASIRLADRLCQTPPRNVDLSVTPLLNRSGRAAGQTRVTAGGQDPNRCWHEQTPWREDLCERLLHSDLVIDLHADERAHQPYIVEPVPCVGPVERTVKLFIGKFRKRYGHRLSRPSPIGEGEDHPGILINWLAAHGIAGVMLELPMRHTHGNGLKKFCWNDMKIREADLARALTAAIEDAARASAMTLTEGRNGN